MIQMVPGSFRPIVVKHDEETDQYTVYLDGEGDNCIATGKTEEEARAKFEEMFSLLCFFRQVELAAKGGIAIINRKP